MSKKKTGAIPTTKPREGKKMIIDMQELSAKQGHKPAAFRTGRYMTAKDRPRKKNWMREAW